MEKSIVYVISFLLILRSSHVDKVGMVKFIPNHPRRNGMVKILLLGSQLQQVFNFSSRPIRQPTIAGLKDDGLHHGKNSDDFLHHQHSSEVLSSSPRGLTRWCQENPWSRKPLVLPCGGTFSHKKNKKKAKATMMGLPDINKEQGGGSTNLPVIHVGGELSGNTTNFDEPNNVLEVQVIPEVFVWFQRGVTDLLVQQKEEEKKKRIISPCAILYGRIDAKTGVRFVDAIFEIPLTKREKNKNKNKKKMNSCYNYEELLSGPKRQQADNIAHHFGLRVVGWCYFYFPNQTSTNQTSPVDPSHKFFIPFGAREVAVTAQLQNQCEEIYSQKVPKDGSKIFSSSSSSFRPSDTIIVLPITVRSDTKSRDLIIEAFRVTEEGVNLCKRDQLLPLPQQPTICHVATAQQNQQITRGGRVKGKTLRKMSLTDITAAESTIGHSYLLRLKSPILLNTSSPPPPPPISKLGQGTETVQHTVSVAAEITSILVTRAVPVTGVTTAPPFGKNKKSPPLVCNMFPPFSQFLGFGHITRRQRNIRRIAKELLRHCLQQLSESGNLSCFLDFNLLLFLSQNFTSPKLFTILVEQLARPSPVEEDQFLPLMHTITLEAEIRHAVDILQANCQPNQTAINQTDCY